MYNRRQFIGFGASAFIAASGRVFGAESPSNRVRLAIVGCHERGRGQQVMKSALRVPGVDIACVCDAGRCLKTRPSTASYSKPRTTGMPGGR